MVGLVRLSGGGGRDGTLRGLARGGREGGRGGTIPGVQSLRGRVVSVVRRASRVLRGGRLRHWRVMERGMGVGGRRVGVAGAVGRPGGGRRGRVWAVESVREGRGSMRRIGVGGMAWLGMREEVVVVAAGRGREGTGWSLRAELLDVSKGGGGGAKGRRGRKSCVLMPPVPSRSVLRIPLAGLAPRRVPTVLEGGM